MESRGPKPEAHKASFPFYRRRRRGVPVRVAWRHQRFREKAHAISISWIVREMLSGVRDVPLVDGNRAATSDVTAQVAGMHSNTGFIPGL